MPQNTLSTSEAIPAKSPSGPIIIADTVFTALNEEKDREKRQLNLIIHNLAESNSDRDET